MAYLGLRYLRKRVFQRMAGSEICHRICRPQQFLRLATVSRTTKICLFQRLPCVFLVFPTSVSIHIIVCNRSGGYVHEAAANVALHGLLVLRKHRILLHNPYPGHALFGAVSLLQLCLHPFCLERGNSPIRSFDSASAS